MQSVQPSQIPQPKYKSVISRFSSFKESKTGNYDKHETSDLYRTKTQKIRNGVKNQLKELKRR